jgi:hypothetical protein
MGEDLSERIKGDLLERILSCLAPLLDRRATVIFTGGKADAAGLLKTLDGILTTKAGIVASDNFLSLAPPEFKAAIEDRLLKDYGSMQKHIAASHLVVVPILTRNTLAKAASGIQDNLASCGFAGALMRGIPVIAVRENCDPFGAHFKELGLDKNPAYSNMLKEHERRLVSFGVKMVDACEFQSALETGLYPGVFGASPAAAIPSAPAEPAPQGAAGAPVILKDSFITCEDLMRIPAGSSLQVAKGAVLTPLAKEYIERRGIAIIHKYDI